MPKHVMFDIDGTLIQSYEFDEALFIEAVYEVTGDTIDSRWENYPNVTNWGLLRTFCEHQARNKKFDQWYPSVKSVFTQKVREHLVRTPAQELPGARSFFHRLIQDSNYTVSIATGCWGESAERKLASSGFDIGNINFKSSDDHYQRSAIMRLAALSSKTNYFGDGEWDKTACAELDYNFIGVGKRVKHHQKIDHFLNEDEILKLLT